MSQQVVPMFYVYAATIPNVAANGGTGSATITFESNSSFELQKMMAAGFDQASDAVLDGAGLAGTVQIVDTSTGANMFSQPVLFDTLFGTAQLPFILPQTRLFSPNSSLIINVVNLDTAHQLTYYFSFASRKLFGYVPARNA